MGALAGMGQAMASPTAATVPPAVGNPTVPLTLPSLTPIAVQNPNLAQPTPDGSSISPLALAAYGISP